MKQEFLELGHPYKPAKHNIAGWFDSEKIDGMRCFWDGGITRGMMKAVVPWANTAKDGRYKKPQIATGLWSRYGNVIHAPDYWLDKMPRIPYDAELWHGKRGDGQRANLMRIVKAIKPGPGWMGVSAYVFNLVPLETIFADRVINTTNYKKTFSGIMDWIKDQHYDFKYVADPATLFQFTIDLMCIKLEENPYLRIVNQEQLSFVTEIAEDSHRRLLVCTTNIHGEGRILTHPGRVYRCERRHEVLKDKPLHDAEGTITGYIAGKRGKEEKLLGKIGAFILDYKGKRLELSGFTHHERVLRSNNAIAWAKEHPGEEIPSEFEALYYDKGSIITFSYRELSLDGIPLEARYLRKWEVE